MWVCLDGGGAALWHSCRTVGRMHGFKKEQVFADSILTFKKDFVATSRPLPLPWVEIQKKESMMLLICSIIRCLVEYSSSTKVPNHNNHNPGHRYWPWAPPQFLLKAAVKCSGPVELPHAFLFLGRLCSGQSARSTMLPGLRGRQCSCNRWKYISVRASQSVYSLARFIYQVWDWKDFPTGYVEISAQQKCFFNKRFHWSGLGFRILAECAGCPSLAFPAGTNIQADKQSRLKCGHLSITLKSICYLLQAHRHISILCQIRTFTMEQF